MDESNKRSIDDTLLFREDISPFLVHLTRTANGSSGREVLKVIIESKQLKPGDSLVSDARFGTVTTTLGRDKQLNLFAATCFTETPINEVHCLLEIDRRKVNLEPYGLVFLKDKLVQDHVSPVCYLNNESRDGDPLIRAITSKLMESPTVAQQFLPLISVFGYHFNGPGAISSDKQVDFRWEREWRRPYACGPMSFDAGDVFVGLCPHGEIERFEQLWPGIGFVDPTRNMKWYATKLIEARQRLSLKNSVV